MDITNIGAENVNRRRETDVLRTAGWNCSQSENILVGIVWPGDVHGADYYDGGLFDADACANSTLWDTGGDK